MAPNPVPLTTHARMGQVMMEQLQRIGQDNSMHARLLAGLALLQDAIALLGICILQGISNEHGIYIHYNHYHYHHNHNHNHVSKLPSLSLTCTRVILLSSCF